jgi:preprotein translocase subunit SecE
LVGFETPPHSKAVSRLNSGKRTEGSEQMARAAARSGKGGPSLVERAKAYWRDTRAEIARVTWPSREQALRLTGIVLAVTASLAVALAVVDYIFAWVVARILAFDPYVSSAALLVLVGGFCWWLVAGRRR